MLRSETGISHTFQLRFVRYRIGSMIVQKYLRANLLVKATLQARPRVCGWLVEKAGVLIQMKAMAHVY